MLIELNIQNFAIIERLTVPFSEGLTVLTGETGAGKSIIIDALTLLAGARSSAEYVRFGEDRAVIEGLFHTQEEKFWEHYLQAHDISNEEETIILRREILSSGKSVCKVNGKLVPLSILREVAQHLIDIHGQHDTQSLLDQSYYKSFISSFCKETLTKPLEAYQGYYKQFLEKKEELRGLLESDKESTLKLDLLEYQRKEIQEAGLDVEEEDKLMSERKRLLNYQKMHSGLMEVIELFSDDKGVLNGLRSIERALGSISHYDEKIAELAAIVEQSYYSLEDASFTLSQLQEGEDFDIGRLAEIEERLNVYARMKRKYGNTVEEILQYEATLNEEWDQIQNREFYIQKAKRQILQLNTKLMELSDGLFIVRKKQAKELQEQITEQLKALYMEKAIFQVECELQKTQLIIENETVDSYTFREDGAEIVQFLITTNPGEPLKPLAKIASGGELSRIMLAIKTIFATELGVTSIILDEVDTGVSGRVAQAMGEKIAHIARNSQVIAITHLPHIAALANQHLYITKNQQEESTTSQVEVLDFDERVIELSRMISGNEITEATKSHVRNMLVSAQK